MIPVPATLWPEVSRLLDEALELHAQARDAWLQRLRSDQPALYPIVHELLATHAEHEASDFLKCRPALMAEACRRAIEDEPTEQLQAGDAIGHYRLLRELGSGGMAVVWLAERSDGKLTRQVALKLPQRFVWRPGLAERFSREGDILARLEHNHIARLYDADVCAADGPGAGRPFLVLEYVEGTHLTEYCDQHRLDTAQRLALFMQVLEAVQYAHTRLVIHRDLKPANILVNPSGEVKLLDFGVAKLLADADDPGVSSALTQQVGRLFTPDYASPEQVRGEALGTTSDIYALGVVLYELLSGQRPYRLTHSSPAQLEQAITEVDPAPPSSRVTAEAAIARSSRPQALQRSLRGELDTIVLKALHKRPEQRYNTVTELAEDLRRHRDGQPVLARPKSRVYRVRKFVLRNRLGVGAAVLIALALLIGIAVSMWQASVAQRQALRARAIQAFMADIFRTNTDAQADPLKARQTTARELLDIGAKRIDSNLQDDPEGRAEVLVLLGDMYYALGLDEQAAGLYERRVAALKAAFGTGDQRVAQALSSYGQQLEGLGERGDEQRRVLDEAKSILDRLGDTHSEQRAELLSAMATAYSHSGQQAIDYARQSVAIFRQHYPDSPDFSNALNRLGISLWRVDDLTGAEAAFIETLTRLGGDKQASVSTELTALLTLASVQNLLQKVYAAEATYRRALALTLERNGEEHVDTLHSKSAFGLFLLRTSRRDEAWQLLHSAEAMVAQHTYAPYPANVVRSSVAQALLFEGRWDEAESRLGSVIDYYRKVAGGKSPLLVAALRLRAEQRLGQDRLADADSALAEATSLLAQLSPEQQRTVSSPVALVTARIALRRQQPDIALQALARVVPRRGAEHNPLPVDLTQAQALRALALLQQGLDRQSQDIADALLGRIRASPLRQYYRWMEADALEALGRVMLRDGQTDGACRAFDAVVSLRLASFGEGSTPVLSARRESSACSRG